MANGKSRVWHSGDDALPRCDYSGAPLGRVLTQLADGEVELRDDPVPAQEKIVK